jgi:hypothetical protein
MLILTEFLFSSLIIYLYFLKLNNMMTENALMG